MRRPRLSITNFSVRSAECPLCGESATEYGLRYFRGPVRAGTPHQLTAVYRCGGCGWAAEAGRRPERVLSGNGERWPLAVPSELRRFARRGRLRRQPNLLAAGQVLTWYPSGGTWLTGGRDAVLVKVTPKARGGRLVWQRRSLEPIDDEGREFAVEYRSVRDAAQASRERNLLRGLAQRGPPAFALLGEDGCGTEAQRGTAVAGAQH